MAYFPNGATGDRFQAKWCSRCMNEDEDRGCPVWGAHLLFEYRRGEKVAKMLDHFIPHDETGIHPDRCTMFLRSPDEEPPEGPAYRMAVEMQKDKP